MKKLIKSSFLILAILLTSCHERDNVFISGMVSGGEKTMLYLDFLKINKIETLDSLRIKKDGSFKFGFRAEGPGIFILRSNTGKIINLLPSPGEELVINSNYSTFNQDYTVAGSPESEHIRQLVYKLLDTREKLTQLDNAFGSLSNITEEQASEYISRRKAIIKDQRDYSIHFIIENLNSIASIYALYQEINEGQYVLGENRDIQYMKIVADSVSKAYPDVEFVKSFVKDARNAEQRFYNLKGLSEKIKTAEAGTLDLAIPDPQGDTVSLSSLKGKVVLIYFWSAMSKECRALNPQLMETYEANKAKGFEIYAIALDNSKDLWKRVISYDELSWVNVSELSFPDSEAANLYNVKVLPSSFLLNRDGEVVARDIFGNELQRWLDNML